MSEHEILAGDARLLLPETFVADSMIVDPPYHAHVHKNATSQDQHNGGFVRHNDLGFSSLTEEFRTWICRLAARTRRWSIIYTDIESVSDWKRELELAGATYIRTLPWVRWSSPQLSGDRPPQGFECLIVAHGSAKGRKHWNGAGNLTHLAHPLDWDGPNDLLTHLANQDWNDLTHLTHLAMRGAEKHKTQKPLDQLLDLVSWFSDPEELVCDPCSGSGTSGLACKILGRKFIGCELDAEWAVKANARIQAFDSTPGTLSPRDLERFTRWTQTTEVEKGRAVDRKTNTERVRKRLADKKNALAGGAPSALTGAMAVNGAPSAYATAVNEAPSPPIVSSHRTQTGDLSDKALEMIFSARRARETEADLVRNLAQVAAQNPDALPLAAQLLGVPPCPSCGFVMRPGHVCQTKIQEKTMNDVPKAWTQVYQRCLADLEEAAYGVAERAAIEAGHPLTEREAIEAGHPYPTHCGSTFCLLRPLQTDERETACGCGCPSCSELSKHMRPPSGGGRTDGAGAPEPAAPPAAIVRPPLTSAAERTVPLFDPPFEDEYTAKKWREAYEHCLRELAPLLSPTLRARVAARLAATPVTALVPTRAGETIDTALLMASSVQIDAAVAAMSNGADAVMPALTGDGAEFRCPLCIDGPERCESCRDFAAKNESALPAWATAKVPYTGRLAPGEAIPNPRMFMKDDVPVSATEGCTACKRGDERPFTHLCEKGQAVGEAKQSESAPRWVATSPPTAEKRGKGRPPGSKNKAPKPWKQAYERVMVELGAS